MKRILAVVGSPRRNGNTHLLVAKLAEGARSQGAAVDELFLADFTVRQCDGCHGCWKAGQCSKADDMRGIYPRIIMSDAIIFGTPVYWYGPTGLMKMFIDRFVYFNCPANRAKIRGKAAVMAVPFEEKDPETARLVEEFFQRSLGYLEMRLVGRVIAPGVGEKGAILARTDYMAQAYELGRKLA